MESNSFPIGKLNPKFLEELFSSLSDDKRVIVGPGIGKDAAVIDFGKTCLVVKTDPITFTSGNLGWYSVNINANDIACLGAAPRWFLATLLLPRKGTSEALVKRIFEEINSACQKLGISLIGGHTEVTFRVDQPLMVGQMIGEVSRERLIDGSRVKVGNAVLLTKGIAVEGTHVIYQEKGEELKEQFSDEMLSRMKNLIYSPGISVVKEALLASKTGKVHLMHDPTEGGLKTGLWEMAYASGVGMKIEKKKIPILEETEAVCRLYGLDPLGLLASGALLLIIDRGKVGELCQVYEKEGIECSVIGEVVSREKGVKIVEGEKELNLFESNQDELNKVLQMVRKEILDG
jgi:hydrogenase maturation factor